MSKTGRHWPVGVLIQSMAGKADFTPEQWQVLLDSPSATAMGMVMIDYGPDQVLREAAVVARFMKAAKERYGDNTLVQDVLADLESRAGRPVQTTERSPVAQAKLLLGKVEDAVAILDASDSADARGFKELLYALAVNVAKAAAEEGSVRNVSKKEAALLKKLRATLGL